MVAVGDGKNYHWLLECPDKLLERSPDTPFLCVPANLMHTATLELQENLVASKTNKTVDQFTVKFVRPLVSSNTSEQDEFAISSSVVQRAARTLFSSAFVYVDTAEENGMKTDVDTSWTIVVMNGSSCVCAATYAMCEKVIILKHLECIAIYEPAKNKSK